MWARCGIQVIIVVGVSFDRLWNWEGLALTAYTSAFHWEVSKLGLVLHDIRCYFNNGDGKTAALSCALINLIAHPLLRLVSPFGVTLPPCLFTLL